MQITVTTRTGKKVHYGNSRSSITRCGVWLRTEGSFFQIDAPVTCERCMDASEPATAELDPKEALVSEIKELALRAESLKEIDEIRASYKLFGFSLRHWFYNQTLPLEDMIRDGLQYHRVGVSA